MRELGPCARRVRGGVRFAKAARALARLSQLGAGVDRLSSGTEGLVCPLGGPVDVVLLSHIATVFAWLEAVERRKAAVEQRKAAVERGVFEAVARLAQGLAPHQGFALTRPAADEALLPYLDTVFGELLAAVTRLVAAKAELDRLVSGADARLAPCLPPPAVGAAPAAPLANVAVVVAQYALLKAALEEADASLEERNTELQAARDELTAEKAAAAEAAAAKAAEHEQAAKGLRDEKSELAAQLKAVKDELAAEKAAAAQAATAKAAEHEQAASKLRGEKSELAAQLKAARDELVAEKAAAEAAATAKAAEHEQAVAAKESDCAKLRNDGTRWVMVQGLHGYRP